MAKSIRCRPTYSYRSGDTSGCVNKGCDEGFVCDTEVGCRPSLCGCDSETGEWWCTEDCDGGTCVEK